MTATRYTFVRTPGSRYGELHRERAGFVKIVARAYLNSEGWLTYGNGGWLRPATFRMVTEEPVRVPTLVLDRVIAEAMTNARRMLGERYHAHPPIDHREPFTSSERDTRYQESL